MTAPLRPRSPRWSVLLRVGIGAAAFGLFVALFSYPATTFGFVVFGIGLAFLLAALVTYFRAAAVERDRIRGSEPPSRRMR